MCQVWLCLIIFMMWTMFSWYFVVLCLKHCVNIGYLFIGALKYEEYNPDNRDLLIRTWQFGPIILVDPYLKKIKSETLEPKSPCCSKIKDWIVGLGPCGWPKLPGKQIKNRLIYWVWPNNKWAELMGSAHLKHRNGPGWILCHISLPRWMPTWPGEVASDQNATVGIFWS